MFTWLYVPPCRKPQLGVDMINEQKVVAINQNKITYQMLRRRSGLFYPTQVDAGINPRQDLRNCCLFQSIQWNYLHYLRANGVSHIILIHAPPR